MASILMNSGKFVVVKESRKEVLNKVTRGATEYLEFQSAEYIGYPPVSVNRKRIDAIFE